jgi:hypothetical protein
MIMGNSTNKFAFLATVVARALIVDLAGIINTAIRVLASTPDALLPKNKLAKSVVPVAPLSIKSALIWLAPRQEILFQPTPLF